MKKAVLCEFGDSHDDIFYGQFEFLKKSGFETYFIGHRIFEERLKKYDNVDHYLYLDFGKSQFENFKQIWKTWQFIRMNDINYIILNTIEGTPVRNFCLFPFGERIVAGIIHNAGNLTGDSFTFNKIIKPKINRMFTLNSYIWENVGTNLNIRNQWIYPITFPNYEKNYFKPENEFHIVVPGLVEADRRDYFSLLNSVADNPLLEEIKIVFLGKSMHQKGIGREIQKFVSENNLDKNVVLFENFVDWDTFRSYIDGADMLASLIHPEYRNFGNYSTNKITGIYLLSFAHKIPLFSHEYFRTYNDVNTSSVFYNTGNISEMIMEIYNNKNLLKEIKSKMESNPNFDFEFNRKKYIGLLED